MEEIACTCDGLPPHSHIYRRVQYGKRIVMDVDPYDVRIWVDWKAVARPEAAS